MRKQSLFYYETIKLLKDKFPGYVFNDDFPRTSCPEFVFYNQNELYISEIKSEKESSKHSGYTNRAFCCFRQRVKNRTYSRGKKTACTKWILFVYQLYDYSCNAQLPRDAPCVDDPFLSFAFPRDCLLEFLQSWNYLKSEFNLQRPRIKYLRSKEENISIINIRKSVLGKIVSRI